MYIIGGARSKMFVCYCLQFSPFETVGLEVVITVDVSRERSLRFERKHMIVVSFVIVHLKRLRPWYVTEFGVIFAAVNCVFLAVWVDIRVSLVRHNTSGL